jgi:hypothetical protein
MLHWKIIIILIMIKILSFIIGRYYTNNKINELHTDYQHKIERVESEIKICISPTIRDFMMCWIKLTIEMIDYSKAIIDKYPDEDIYYNNLEKTKDELITLFYKIHKDQGDKFKYLINQQIIYKINLCYANVYNDIANVSKYSSDLKTNTEELANFFVQIKKSNQDQEKLKSTMDSHASAYIKSVGVMKKVTDSELTREMIIGSMETVKMLFV